MFSTLICVFIIDRHDSYKPFAKSWVHINCYWWLFWLCPIVKFGKNSNRSAGDGWNKRECRYNRAYRRLGTIFLFPKYFICAISLNMNRRVAISTEKALSQFRSRAFPTATSMKWKRCRTFDANFVSDFYQSRRRSWRGTNVDVVLNSCIVHCAEKRSNRNQFFFSNNLGT